MESGVFCGICLENLGEWDAMVVVVGVGWEERWMGLVSWVGGEEGACWVGGGWCGGLWVGRMDFYGESGGVCDQGCGGR